MQVKVAERQDQTLPGVKADTHLLEQNGGQMENATVAASRMADFTGWKPGERADLCLGPFSSPRYGSYLRCHDNPDQRFHPVQLKGATPEVEVACQMQTFDRSQHQCRCFQNCLRKIK